MMRNLLISIIIIILLSSTIIAQPVKKERNLSYGLDADTSGFALTAWGNECRFRITLKKDGSLRNPFRLFTKPGGNLEWEIILDSKPASNVIIYNIETTGLKFYYQGELTAEAIALNAERPDSVIGSYAVYHASKRGRIYHEDGRVEDYRTGKAFHIYRPWAYDKDGDGIWCDLHIDATAGELTITVPQSYLNKAVYPVTVDPQFGNTSLGASSTLMTGFITAVTVTMAAASGQVLDSIALGECEYSASGVVVDAAIYTDNSGPDALGDESGTSVAPGSACESYGFDQVSMGADYSLTSEAVYWLAAVNDNKQIKLKYDDGAAGCCRYKASTTTFANPFPSGSTSSNLDWSYYGVYKAGAAAELSGRRRRLIILELMNND
ncbi:MAG: hypothetical protein ACYTBJ_26750 [Planctomycetota bacterium]|jgi:hypothetical protein